MSPKSSSPRVQTQMYSNIFNCHYFSLVYPCMLSTNLSLQCSQMFPMINKSFSLFNSKMVQVISLNSAVILFHDSSVNLFQWSFFLDPGFIQEFKRWAKLTKTIPCVWPFKWKLRWTVTSCEQLVFLYIKCVSGAFRRSWGKKLSSKTQQ